jgi:hypothetical protein
MIYYDYKICNCKVKDEDVVFICNICNPIEEATVVCDRRPSIFNESVYSLAFVALVGLAAVLITRLY